MSEQNYFKSLIAIKNNQPVTTSLNVANTFAKKHKNVMKRINKLVAQNGATKNHWFYKQYRTYRGQQFPYYLMNRDGFSLLVMGFTGSIATKFKIQFINAFDEMQKELDQRNNPVNKLMHASKSQLLLVAYKAQKHSEANQKKADYYDKSMVNPGTMTTTVIAKSYGMSAHRLNLLLHGFGVIYKQGKSWVPYSKYQDMKLGSFDTFNYDGNHQVTKLWKWNQRGEKLIHDVMVKHGYKWSDEQLDLLNQEVMEASHNGRY